MSEIKSSNGKSQQWGVKDDIGFTEGDSKKGQKIVKDEETERHDVLGEKQYTLS